MADLAFAPQHNMIAYLEKTESKLNEPTPQGEGSGSGLGRQEIIGGAMDQIRSKGALIQSIDPPLSTDLCTTLLQKVFDLENVKTAQAKKIASLKKKVTKLEQRQSSRFLDEDVDTEMMVEDKGNGEKGGSTAETISTTRPNISAARLELMKNQKAKEKGIAFKDVDDSARPIRSITTLQHLPTIDPKDKDSSRFEFRSHDGKRKTKKAFKATLAEMYDEVQAHIDVDHELVIRLTQEEQEKYTVEERKKRAAALISKHKPPKKQKVNDQEYKDSDKEHRKCLKVVPDDDKAIYYETLDVKSLIIDCESQVLGTNEASDAHVYKLTRLDGSYMYFSTFFRMLEVFDRQDVLDLHKIIMEQYLILWGDLKTLVEQSEDDEIWKNQ
uniref:Uncharacterized protein n=1 Tax=Tanacetum cinerariifolium TaxID=118510 RepID=A0A6L2J2F9_TANCI|nr:hypothetical protein [Tanacetum cinerariifolium]